MERINCLLVILPNIMAIKLILFNSNNFIQHNNRQSFNNKLHISNRLFMLSNSKQCMHNSNSSINSSNHHNISNNISNNNNNNNNNISSSNNKIISNRLGHILIKEDHSILNNNSTLDKLIQVIQIKFQIK